MFRHVFAFELRHQMRQGLFLVTLLFFFVLTFVIVTTDGASVGGASANVDRNAPFVILQLLTSMSLVGLFLTTAFIANTTVRDVESGTAPMFFSTRISKGDYLFGRFTGAFAATVAVSLAAVAAMIAGSFMPWIDPELIGPFRLEPYLFTLAVLVIPNLFSAGAIFFCLATLARSLMATYVGLVSFFVAYVISQNLMQDLEDQKLAALLDPFGIAAVTLTTKYWTVFDQNTRIPELDGLLLTNRLLWTALGVAALVFAYRHFRFTTVLESGGRRLFQRKRKAVPAPEPRPAAPPSLPTVVRSFRPGVRLQQLWAQTRLEVKGVFRGAGFAIILLFGLFNMIGNAGNLSLFVGTDTHPVTYLMLELIGGAFLFLLLIILTFYGGELVWRERSLDLHEVYGALPIPDWVPALAKISALFLITVAVLALALVSAIGIQIFQGYYAFELGLYLKGLFAWQMPGFWIIAVLAVFLQVVSPNKFLGFLLMVAYLLSPMLFAALDWQHNLYQYGGQPNGSYSDMNGYGHYVAPRVWFGLYWALGAAVLGILATIFWRRGTDSGLRPRWRSARRKLRGPAGAALAATTAAFLAVGGWIFYNTNILNDYVPADAAEEQQARYEKLYKELEDEPLPKIVETWAEVDIFPEERRLEIRGRYELVNKTGVGIDRVHVNVPTNVDLRTLALVGAELAAADEQLGFRTYRFRETLAPGAATRLDFELGFAARGFVNHGAVDQVAANGTFFNNLQFFPTLGYQPGGELQDNKERRKHGLEPVVRMAKLDDLYARRNNMISTDADWVRYETVVSTSADQIAVAPGYLQREWAEGDRRFFHYAMDAPILNFYAYLSARYEVLRDVYRGVDIEIYYHPGHEYNLEKMVAAIKDSLDYFGTHFSPYQHRQVRILEFPRYGRFAQAFANTIPFSEGIGFIADLEDENDIDYVYFVTAHEVAHQWWAHQVVPARVQGATMVVESMAEYSALMVMEKKYGPEKMRRFLRHELDNYLRNRGGELIEELPLVLVENQAYIHYRKGSLAFYALRDYLGEETLNRALSAYIERTAFQDPPYTTSAELVEEIRRVAPPERHGVIEDLLETITLYENRVEEATYRRLEDGRYRVELAVEAKKLRADGEGREREIGLDDWIDIGVFARDEGEGEEGERVLYLEKHHLAASPLTLELVVDEPPAEVGIDPYNKLIDRNPEDNRKKPEEAAAAEAR